MGMGNSARPPPRTPIPQYAPPSSAMSPYNISRPPSPVPTMPVGGSPLSRRQQQKLADAHRTIQTLQHQMAAMQRPPSPMPYSGPPIIGPGSGYPPPSPLLQRLSRPSSYQPGVPMGPGGSQSMDYAAVANIAGLNPVDVALLHREYMNLTRGGINRIDRVVFRQLLREALVEANNENIDRTIENIFVSIDRNRDGFIDFPEFVGAFRDVLKGNPYDSLTSSLQSILPSEQQYGATNPGYLSPPLPYAQQPQPITYIQQPQQTPQILTMPATSIQQSPIIYSGPSPLVLPLDQNQSPYIF